MVDISKSDVGLQETINNLDDDRTIYLGSRTFKEKVYVTKPNITLIGEDAKIIYDAYHGGVIPKSLGGDGKKVWGTTGSATFTVKEGADNFRALGISFINCHHKIKNKNDEQAVAFKSEASHLLIEKCEFLSEQDTLYIDLGCNNVIKNSYICGDVDYIFGSAECSFYDCVIESIGSGYVIAPNTYNLHVEGLKFFNCIFKVQGNYEVYLGRPWYPSGAKYYVYPKALFKNCIFNVKINLKFVKMHAGDPFKFELVLVNCMYKGQLLSKNLSEI